MIKVIVKTDNVKIEDLKISYVSNFSGDVNLSNVNKNNETKNILLWIL